MLTRMIRAVPELVYPFLASGEGGFFLRKNPLGSNGFRTLELRNRRSRGATIFLTTTYVLEIVERLCSHVAIISQGRIVAAGSLEELRAGVAGTLSGSEPRRRLTMEEIFLSILGEESRQDLRLELSWLARTELA